MDGETNFLLIPVVNGDNYQAWAIRMAVHLKALDLWETVEEDYEVLPLGDNPSINQMKIHRERKTMKAKAKACLFSTSAVTIWEHLKNEYQGNKMVQNMQLLSIANKVRLYGKEFSDERIVQKILVTLSEKYEATISSLENSKHLSSISLAEIVNALQTLEQRRMMRQKGFVEGAFQAKSQNNDSSKDRKKNKKNKKSRNNKKNQKEAHPPCPHCKKTNRPPQKCWWRLDVKCNNCSQLGHIEKLLGSGCTNHMTYDQGIFRELDKTTVSKVRIGNGEYISTRGKGTVAIESLSGLKLIPDVLFVPNIDQNLLSVGQVLEKGFKVLFEDKFYMIKDANRKYRTPSLKGSKYYIAFIDDYTRYYWIFFLNFKFEVADVFWKYKALVENQSGAVMHVIRTDNGTEYTSEIFNNFCEEVSIEHQLTVPYTPQQNGVVEKKNRTLMEMTRYLLHEKGLPKKFRVEAANTVKRDKLDKKAETGIFVGYNPQSKTYRNFEFFNENIDDIPVRGTKSLSDIYQMCNVAVFEPAGFNEVVEDKKWRKNNTWELVDKPTHKKAIGVKWVYRTKLNCDGSINKHKSRLVVKGYAQMFGVDFSETFAPVGRLDTIRILLALAAQMGWKIYQPDVKSAFLNGYLEEEIFVEQPEGFVVKGKEDKVYHLKKALYGLKQAPRAWYSRINAYLLSLGFKKSQSESTLYIRKINADILIISLYVDDLLVTGSNQCLMDKFKVETEEVFEMIDIGDMSYFLGMEVHQN
uniref:Integrase catalytic domain-containing protein n=1 Tax=Vitis vinifera TaxID=29760 RepID=A5BD08_VITVI|nr:hypothetical protein VITISV_010671 [Vitis vinifera]